MSMNRVPIGILLSAARDSSPVNGLTHNHYRYPARFSPRFVRAVIELFTEPGDLILDPFMGGGTTLVEALALHRPAIGTDISSLATFVSKVKTTLLSDQDIVRLRDWSKHASQTINIHRPSVETDSWAEIGYQKNLGTQRTWRFRKAIEQALVSASHLQPTHMEEFARCIILRTAQWALDSRRKIPTIQQFRDRIIEYADDMLEGTLELRQSAMTKTWDQTQPSIICLNRSVIGLDEELPGLQSVPKLILTSPPYPGIHVLYHRWQVDGRKETPAPFWIANKLDGADAKYYTLGDRKEAELRSYYKNLRAGFRSLRRLCDSSTTLVQLVAFAEPEWQLPQYVDAMRETGFEEVLFPDIDDSDDGRLWRRVPNRRWHADQLGETPSSREVVFIHKPASVTPPHPHFLTDSLRHRQSH